MTSQCILVVDDDPAIRRLVQIQLTASGYRVAQAGNGQSAIETAATENPAAIVLDLGLPDQDGIATLQSLREWYAGPILVLSARNEQAQKVIALDLGADDYVTKPFGAEELLARIRAALRRSQSAVIPGAPVLTVGSIQIDQVAHHAMRDGKSLALTRTEFELLRVLAANAGKVLSHRYLLEQVWGPEYLDESESLRTFIKQLRKKIEVNPARPTLLRTVVGVGYQLSANS